MNSPSERVMEYAEATPIPADDLALLGYPGGGGPDAPWRWRGEARSGCRHGEFRNQRSTNRERRR